MKKQTITYNAYRVDANTLILLAVGNDHYFFHNNKIFYAINTIPNIRDDLITIDCRQSRYNYFPATWTVVNEVME